MQEKTVTDIILKWIPACEYFLMLTKDGLALQEAKETDEPFKILSCLGVLARFINRNKDIPQKYRVTIEHMGEAKEEVIQMEEKIQHEISSKTLGIEGLDINVNYKDTNLKTVILTQISVVVGFLITLIVQAKKVGVDKEYLDAQLGRISK